MHEYEHKHKNENEHGLGHKHGNGHEHAHGLTSGHNTDIGHGHGHLNLVPHCQANFGISFQNQLYNSTTAQLYTIGIPYMSPCTIQQFYGKQ